jgi:hypothetical protein
MIRQVNPHWHAYFLITDEKPFEEELTSILASFGDSRLHFLDISMDYRPPVRVHCFVVLWLLTVVWAELSLSTSDVTVCKVMCTVACKVVLYDG